MQSLSPTIRLHPNDDVVIARHHLPEGAQLAEEDLVVSGLIPAGHKVATRRIAAGQPVRRYNQIIGVAKQDIEPGQHVHTHNLAMAEFARDYAFCADAKPTDYVAEPATFMGFVRPDGRVATRNYVGILCSVNCSATVARAIADHFRRDIRPEALADYPNVDGVVALTHGYGCGVDPEGEGLAILRRTLAGYARHPNFAAVAMIGLGCETNQIGGILHKHGLEREPRLHSFTIQETGGTAKSVARGIELIKELLPEVNAVERQQVPASHLILALQCGGSDGYSGITANPALGAAADLACAPRRHGGPVGDPGDLRRRAPADPPCCLARGGREAGQPHPLVGGLLRAQQRRDGQQPVGRQQGGRPHHHSREIARRGRQGRHHQPSRGLRVRRAGHGQGPRLHGHAGLRPGDGHRPGGGAVPT